MGKARKNGGLSDAARRCAPGGVAARPALSLVRDERGSTAAEYGLMASLIAVVIITGVTLFGEQVGILFTTVADLVTGA